MRPERFGAKKIEHTPTHNLRTIIFMVEADQDFQGVCIHTHTFPREETGWEDSGSPPQCFHDPSCTCRAGTPGVSQDGFWSNLVIPEETLYILIRTKAQKACTHTHTHGSALSCLSTIYTTAPTRWLCNWRVRAP